MATKAKNNRKRVSDERAMERAVSERRINRLNNSLHRAVMRQAFAILYEFEDGVIDRHEAAARTRKLVERL